jgi:hypothetical protein
MYAYHFETSHSILKIKETNKRAGKAQNKGCIEKKKGQGRWLQTHLSSNAQS